MVSIEELGIPDLLTAVNAGVKGVSLRVPLKRGSMEDIGKVKILLARNVGQIRLRFVNSFGKTKFSKIFLKSKISNAFNILCKEITTIFRP